ncbi:DUF3558 family protein [Amycolatopsis circi]|uniref:DUF3558 family protein n=1 Tax=Amycolatopsis circi TaxID=871959 RepID=UPI000E2280BE|nr:DUF3558 family protein [Amycolatopsis circi]
MASRTLMQSAGLVVLAAVAASCSSPGNSGSGLPTSAGPSASTSSSAALPHSGAPKVANPLPSTTLDGSPCDGGLTGDQLNEIIGQAPQGSPDTKSSLGPSCTWINSVKGSYVDVAYDTKSDDGLSSWYANTKPKSVVWKESDVLGFPSVAHVTQSSDSPDEFCQVTIGINDQRTVDVSIGLSAAKKGTVDPCYVANVAAQRVMTNLKHKAGS